MAGPGLVQKRKPPATPTDRTARARDRKAYGSAILIASMSKRNKKSKINKSNLPRSKNSPSGKRNDPDIDWTKYAEGRKSEGRNYIEWMAKVADFVRKLLGIPKGKKDRRVSAVPAAALKSEEGSSRWGLAGHFAKRPGGLERRGLDQPYGKSWRRPRMSQTDSTVPRRAIGWTAGGAAIHGADIADSAGFRHVRIPGLAQRQGRHDRREAACKTARRAPCMARYAPRRSRRAGQTTRRTSGRCWRGCRAYPATCWPMPNTAELKTAKPYSPASRHGSRPRAHMVCAPDAPCWRPRLCSSRVSSDVRSAGTQGRDAAFWRAKRTPSPLPRKAPHAVGCACGSV